MTVYQQSRMTIQPTTPFKALCEHKEIVLDHTLHYKLVSLLVLLPPPLRVTGPLYLAE